MSSKWMIVTNVLASDTVAIKASLRGKNKAKYFAECHENLDSKPQNHDLMTASGGLLLSCPSSSREYAASAMRLSSEGSIV